jgi:hypothetical protein
MPPLDLTLIQALLTGKTISNEITTANDLTTPGFYFVENPQLANMPTRNWGHVFVNANTAKNRIVQICFPDSSQSVWFRMKSDDSWSDWKQFVISSNNNLITIDDPQILSEWYGMLSYQADGTYANYSIAPTGIMIEQRPSSDLTFYFKFVLPVKPESITDDHPRPLGIGTSATNLNYSIQTLAMEEPGIHKSLSMIEPELILDNPSGGNLIYSARSKANGTFTDLDQAMYIAPNTDQLSPAPPVNWGDTVIMTLCSHTVRYNPFPSGGSAI